MTLPERRDDETGKEWAARVNAERAGPRPPMFNPTYANPQPPEPPTPTGFTPQKRNIFREVLVCMLVLLVVVCIVAGFAALPWPAKRPPRIETIEGPHSICSRVVEQGRAREWQCFPRIGNATPAPSRRPL